MFRSHFFRKSRILVKKKLIYPITRSVYPVNGLALGIAVGMFWALTPLVGVQMYLVFLSWLFFRSVFKVNFDWIVGAALVWISNPLTMFFLYYGFYIVGFEMLKLAGAELSPITYDLFKSSFSAILDDPNLNYFEIIYYASKFLVVELGASMALGALVIALPTAIASYFFSRPWILKLRRRKAAKLGMDYEEWRKRFEKTSDKATLSA